MSSDNKPTSKLSQWDALMLESLTAYGWSKEELLRRVHAGELPQDESKFQFQYEQLTAMAASDPAAFEDAVRNGYQIKYNTLRGIASWILLALGHEAELVLEPGQETVVAHLTPAERGRLATMLSHGWVIRGEHQGADGDKSLYRIEPMHRA